jgi:hypothetical protein
MICAFAHTVSAQTEWMNNYPSVALGDQVNPHLARPSRDDITIMVFESNESGAWKVIAQGIDNANGLPLWDALDGVAVCSANGEQRNPRAAYDSLGHVLIVWEDYRNGDEPSIYVQCLNVSDGRVAAGWPDEGVAVCDLASAADQPRIAGSVDGAYIAWRDWRNSTSSVPNRDVYVSYIMSLTADIPQGGAYQWVGDGLRVPFPGQQDCDQSDADIAREYMWTTTPDNIERDGVILVYQDRRHTSATTGDSIYNVYATRFDALGNTPWSDVRCASHDEEQLYPRLVVEGRRRGVGDSTAIMAWQDAREDAWGPVYDIYGTVLDRHDGVVIVAAGGIVICDHPGTQRYPDLALYEEDEDPQISKPYLSRVSCAWEDLRDVQSRGVDVYCAVLDGTSGAHANPSGASGEELSTRLGDQTQVRVDHFPDDADAYFVWTDWNNDAGATDHSDVWYQGLQVKTMQFHRSYGSGFEVAVAKGDQCTPQAGGNVFVFADKRRQSILYDALEDWNIYAETPGDCVGPREMKWRDMFADVRQSGHASDMHFATDDVGNILVVWEKATDEEDKKDIYIQKLDVDGVPRWTNSGIKLNTMPGASHARVCISDSSGGAQVAWQQPDDNGIPEVWYAKISPRGALTHREDVLNYGTKPVIAYARRTFHSLASNSPLPAYIGFLETADRSPAVYCFSTNTGDWENLPTANQLSSDTLQLDATAEGEVFLAAWQHGNDARLQVIWGTKDAGALGFLNEFTTSVSQPGIGGCAIAADLVGTSGVNPSRGGFIVYSADLLGSGLLDLYAHHIPSGAATIGTVWKLTNAFQGDIGATHPVMCPDSSVNASGYGGMLLAWNWQYLAPSYPPEIRNHLFTNKLDYILAQDRIQFSSWYDYHVSISWPEPMHASIARIRPTGPDIDTMALIVWKGVTELCSPSRPYEIVGQWVVYDTASLYRGPQWVPERAIGPGIGSYGQYRPLARTSSGNTVSVFWHDERGESDLIVGTRLWVDDADARWVKGPRRSPSSPPIPTLTLGESWPNPLSLSRTSVASLNIVSNVEQHVILALYDVLGRRVRMIHDGRIPAGTRTLHADLGGLTAGIYYFVLRAGASAATRGQVIVR